MRRPMCGVSILAILLGMLFSLAGTRQAAAEVQVNVNIGPPPRYVVPAPPPVVVIPGTYVYLVPDIAVDILFYNGYWYRPHEGHWFRARSYNGPWAYLAPPQVPRVLIELPPDYRRVPPGYHRTPYGQLKKNYGRWERERYWEKDREWREGWHGRPEGRGEERGGGHEGHEGQGHGGHDGHGGGHEGR